LYSIQQKIVVANFHNNFLKQIINFAQPKKDEMLMCSATVCFQAFGDKSDIDYLKKLSFTEAYYKSTGETIAKRIEKKYGD